MGNPLRTSSRDMTPTRLLSLLFSLLAVSLVNSRSAELTTRINKASIDVCLEGWLRGEASIIGAHADQENFYFEWVPTGERYPFKEFPAFYNQFLCQPAGSQSDSGDLNMNCVHTAGDQDRTVMILIPRDVIGDISLDRLYDKNVK